VRAGCREIQVGDAAQVIDLLTRGFTRPQSYWARVWDRMTAHPSPEGWPKYGYALEVNGRLVGVVLLIVTAVVITGKTEIRANVSSWYVEPEYQLMGTILSMRAVRQEAATYFNVSPAPHTWPILERQGFVPFVGGRIITVPALLPTANAEVRSLDDTGKINGLSQHEITILRDHQKYDCFSLVCSCNGEVYPFVFGRQLRRKLIPVAHLVYCRDYSHFVRFAGAIGRYLIRRGYLLIIADAMGAPRIGWYFGGRRRSRKGNAVRLGDVAYSEQVIFGY
jgi:hypothetical protein